MFETNDNCKYPELKELIEDIGITKIISIDDEWEQTKKDVSYVDYNDISLNEFASQKAIRINEKQKEVISNAQIITVKELLENESDELIKLKEKVYKKLDKKEYVIPEELKVIEDIAEDIEITLETSIDKESTIYDNTTGKNLVILDIEMDNVRGDSDQVIETIVDINEKRENKLDLILIYSNNRNSEVFSNFEDKKNYVKSKLQDKENVAYDCVLIAHQICGLTKEKNKDELAIKLTYTIEKTLLGHILFSYFKFEINKTNKVFNSLFSISNEKLEPLFFNSFFEGELFIDMLEKTKNGISNKIELDEINKITYNEILQMVQKVANRKGNTYDNVLNTKTNSQKKKYPKSITRDSIKNRNFIDIRPYTLIDYSINKKYSNIATGDIFRIRYYSSRYNSIQERIGILMTRECNLVIRYDNKYENKKRDKDIGKLLLFNLEELKESCEDKDIDKIEKSIFPVIIEDKYYYLEKIKDDNIINIPLKILDLCTLNDDGSSIIPINSNKWEKYKTYLSKEYFKEAIKEIKNDISKLKLKYETDIITSFICKEEACATREISENNHLIDLLIGMNFSIEFSINDMKFSVTRIGKLEEFRTLEFIQELSSDSSKIPVGIAPYV